MKCRVGIGIFSILLLCRTSSAQNTITENNDNCVGIHALPDPLYVPINLYPKLFYDINPYITGNVIYNNATYDLVFSDEFNGSTSDMLNNWIPSLGGRGSKLNNISDNGEPKPPGILSYSYNLNDPNQNTIEVSNGTLKLWARQLPSSQSFNVVDYRTGDDPNDLSIDCNDSLTPDIGDCIIGDGFPNRRNFDYTHGEIKTQRAFKHGYFEARIKLPVVDMVWPAFWLWRTESGKRTEIDIFEFNMFDIYDNQCNIIPNEDQVTRFEEANAEMDITYHDWWFSNSNVEKCHSRVVKAQDGFSFVNEWHNYGLYWDEYKMIWFVDGDPVWYVYKYYLGNTLNANEGIWDYLELIYALNGLVIAPKTNLGFPSDHSWIILGMGVQNFGGTYDSGNDMTCTTPLGSLPKNMEIDWLRVFSNRSCDAIYLNCDENQLPSNIAAEKIIIPDPAANNCEVVVQNARQDAMAWGDFTSAQQIDMVANDFIRLTPGFRTEKGITLSARIDNCPSADLRNSVDTSSQYVNSLLAKAYEKFKQGKDFEVDMQNPVDEEIFAEIYPNPNNGNFGVRVDEKIVKGINTVLEIVTIEGKIVYNKIYLSGMQNTISINTQLEDGIYFLKIATTENSIIKKFIVTSN